MAAADEKYQHVVMGTKRSDPIPFNLIVFFFKRTFPFRGSFQCTDAQPCDYSDSLNVVREAG